MSTELSVVSELKQFGALTNEQLKTELASALSSTAQSMIKMAAIVRLLEERGEDLSALRLGMITNLRKIAYGQLVPEAVVRFADFPALLHRIGALPLPEQQRLAAGEPVKLLTSDGSHLLADPLNLTYDQVMQVFAKGALRTDEQQATYRQSAAATKRKMNRPQGRVRADKERVGIRIGNARCSAAEALAALSELSEPVEESGDNTAVNLDSAVVRLLKIQSAKRDTTIRDLVVRACMAAGLLRE